LSSKTRKNVRVFLLVFTIELFYRLGAISVPARWIVPVLCSLTASFFIHIIVKVKKQGVRHAVRMPFSLFMLFCLFGAVYGWSRGVREIIVAPVVGRPVHATGSVTSIFTGPDYQIANLVLTDVDSGPERYRCRLSVSCKPKMRAQSQLVQGEQVQLVGVLAAEQSSPNKPRSWLLGSLQPTYRFYGEVEPVVKENSTSESRWDVRSRLRQMTLKKYSHDPKMKAAEGLLESIVFGGNTVSDQTHQVFLRAGVLHVLAASGANLLLMERITAPVLFWVFGKLPFGRYAAFGGLLGFIWLYTALCGGQASILRAAWMSSYRTIGRIVGRTPSTGTSIWFAALCMSMYSPSQLWSISAILSFVATYAVDSAINRSSTFSVKREKNAGTSRFSVLWQTLWSFVKGILWTSISVELYTAPLVEALFGQWTPYAVFSNLLIEPILAILLPFAALWFGFVFVSFSYPVFSSVCDVWAICLLFILQLLENVLTWIASLPGSLVILPVFPPVWFLGYYTCLILLSSLRPSARTILQMCKPKMGWSSKRL
jgi:ComEC/Rec2-related protein